MTAVVYVAKISDGATMKNRPKLLAEALMPMS
jgi:hypothetical protein